jgi:hypothetical protein
MMLSAAFERVIPKSSILFKGINRPRVRIAVVEISDLIRDSK